MCVPVNILQVLGIRQAGFALAVITSPAALVIVNRLSGVVGTTSLVYAVFVSQGPGRVGEQLKYS